MLASMLKSKLHHATVTAVEPDYEGSLMIDVSLMEAVKIRPYEKVLVANLRNGERFETYAIPGPRNSGVICLNGAAALLGATGDRLIILTFALIPDEEAASHSPLVLVLNAQNKPIGGLRQT
jgi:aspartate 1-decarboxylase